MGLRFVVAQGWGIHHDRPFHHTIRPLTSTCWRSNGHSLTVVVTFSDFSAITRNSEGCVLRRVTVLVAGSAGLTVSMFAPIRLLRQSTDSYLSLYVVASRLSTTTSAFVFIRTAYFVGCCALSNLRPHFSASWVLHPPRRLA